MWSLCLFFLLVLSLLYGGKFAARQFLQGAGLATWFFGRERKPRPVLRPDRWCVLFIAVDRLLALFRRNGSIGAHYNLLLIGPLEPESVFCRTVARNFLG